MRRRTMGMVDPMVSWPERIRQKGSGEMRVALLVVAGLALAGFLLVAMVLPKMAADDAKDAAQSLLAGVETAKQQVTERAEKAGNLGVAGKDMKIASRDDPRYGAMKWIVADNGAI